MSNGPARERRWIQDPLKTFAQTSDSRAVSLKRGSKSERPSRGGRRKMLSPPVDSAGSCWREGKVAAQGHPQTSGSQSV
jgi:hypothetical protein